MKKQNGITYKMPEERVCIGDLTIDEFNKKHPLGRHRKYNEKEKRWETQKEQQERLAKLDKRKNRMTIWQWLKKIFKRSRKRISSI